MINMEKLFYDLSDKLFNSLLNQEKLLIGIKGEKSQFIRFNQSKVRQSGIIEDAKLELCLINNSRTCSGSFTLSGNINSDELKSFEELSRLRREISGLPRDPFIVLPKDTGSSREIFEGDLLPFDKSVSSLSPSMKGCDLAGIWASGHIYIGNANSSGQRHWFETDSFSLDYSLITLDEKMVKSTYAGNKWNQLEYEKNMSNSISQLHLMERKNKKIKPGEYRTYIAPAGVADIIDMFSWGGVGESSIQQGDSSLCKMRKEAKKMSSCFSLSEDFSSGLVPRFNANGELAPSKLNLISSGNLENTLVSTRTSKEYNVTSNFADENESLRSPAVSPGNLDEDEILKSIDQGIYLSNLHYLNWSDRSGGRVTGMTRYACFWVEGGEIVSPIENMRFDDSIYNFFGDKLESVTNKAHLHPNVGTYDGREVGGVLCPGILLKSFKLTL